MVWICALRVLDEARFTAQGRVGILHVHARNKKVEEDVDFDKVARATAGFTGADLMNLMNQAAIMAVRGVRSFPCSHLQLCSCS